MELKVTSVLNPSQEREIQSLMEACRKKEAVSLSFPFNGEALYVLVSDQGRICTASAFLKEDDDTYECAAFTHPASRRRGFFSAALEKGLSLLPPEADILFYTDEKNSGAKKALDSLEAELISKEYMMELSLREKADVLSPAIKAEDPSVLHVKETLEDGEKTLLFSNAFGSVKITVFPSHYYLYGFLIQEPFRGQGHGEALLLAVLGFLAASKEMPVSLQVSGDNLPAVSLYEKTGFRITETLSCYLY